MEQVCSLEGDYNGFTTDLAHSFATPLPSAIASPPKSTTLCVLQPIVPSFVGTVCEVAMRSKALS